MTPLFRDMIALHESNASELARELQSIGEKSDDQGSFMSVVHQTIMDVRSLFNGLDESVLPGLIDGEQRNVSKYDDALKTNLPAELASLLTAQRGKIAKKITQMKVQNASSTQSA